MRPFVWLACAAILGGCDFGDNEQVRQGPPDAAGGSALLDAAVPDSAAEIDAAVTDAATVMACSLVPQGGCSGATPACDLTSADDGSTECRSVTSQGTSNDHCASATACKAGYSCVHHESTDTPWCARFCLHDSGCSGTGSRCVIGLTNASGTPIGVSVCSNACDPYGQTGCPSGMACLPYDASAGDFTDCVYAGTEPDGHACTSSEQCERGSMCVDTAGNLACRAMCIVGDSSSCAAGETCTAFISPIVIGAVEYGGCL
jgi:hypothetical protein